MRHRRAYAERIFVDVVERRQAAWEELAIDDAFGETVDRSKAKLLGQLYNALANEPLPQP